MNPLAELMRSTAASLGITPLDLATAISFETGGTFDPTITGPTTKWGKHRGLIQFGEPQAEQYGVSDDWSAPNQMRAVGDYLRDAGVQPGMGLLDVYSAINAGRVGRYNASDTAAGGTPGTVRDKVLNQMGGHVANAERLLAFNPQSEGQDPGSFSRLAPAQRAIDWMLNDNTPVTPYVPGMPPVKGLPEDDPTSRVRRSGTNPPSAPENLSPLARQFAAVRPYDQFLPRAA